MGLNVSKIREDFPILDVERNGKPIVYADSACQALKPKKVFNAILEYYTEYSACGGRSPHAFGIRTTDTSERSRETAAKFLGAREASEIVWTRNTTEAINIVARGLSWEKDDVIITDNVAHNSNYVPWFCLKKNKGIDHQIFEIGIDGAFDLDRFESLLGSHSSRVKLVSLCQTSNLTGATIPDKVVKLSHDYGALVLFDAAQSFPHRPIDVKNLDVDFLAVSMHKACGPTGMGFLYGKHEALSDLAPLITGGETVSDVIYPDTVTFLDPPSLFEAGLQNYAGIIGSGAAMEYLSSIGMQNILDYEKKISERLLQGIEELGRNDLEILGPKDPTKRAALAAIKTGEINPHEIAMLLDEMKNIFTRSGMHCTHGFHRAKGLSSGTLRPSFYFYNTLEEVDLFSETLGEILSMIS